MNSTKKCSGPINSTKKCNRPINSNKNKLNSEIIFIFHWFSNGGLVIYTNALHVFSKRVNYVFDF